jgi:hypothetical protein
VGTFAHWLRGGAIGGGRGATFTTRVSGSVRLSGLTGDQATQLCDDVTSANTATLEPTYCASGNQGNAVLTANAYLTDNPTASNAEIQMQCAQVLTSDETGGCPPAATCDAAAIVSNSPTCTATVADVVNCINENDALTRKLLAATPACEAVTASSLSVYLAPEGPFDTYNVTSMSASCAAVNGCNGIWTLSNGPTATTPFA